MLSPMQTMIAALVLVIAGVVLLIVAPGETNAVFAGIVITGGLSLLGVQGVRRAMGKKDGPDVK